MATCIGEEGLDIGNVDIIIQYDLVNSPIRDVQRSGRTGRAREGIVVQLVMEGREALEHMQGEKKKSSLTKTLKTLNQVRAPAVDYLWLKFFSASARRSTSTSTIQSSLTPCLLSLRSISKRTQTRNMSHTKKREGSKDLRQEQRRERPGPSLKKRRRLHG